MTHLEPFSEPPSSPHQLWKRIGNGVALVGVLMFLSVFVSGALNFGNFDNFEARGQSMALRGVFGMLFMIGGGAIHGIALKNEHPQNGPDQPSNDGTWQSDGEEALTGPIKIRCSRCRTLNDEAAKYCDQCGTSL